MRGRLPFSGACRASRFCGDAMQVKVMFLGPARDFAGTDSGTFELPEVCDVGRLRRKLEEHYPALKKAPAAIRIAVNCSFEPDDFVLHANDEVALIPPVSGG